jgi:hypothetical protein
VRRDIQEEFPVSSSVGKLVLGRRSKRQAADHKGTGVIGKILVAALPFFTDKSYRFELAEPEP